MKLTRRRFGWLLLGAPLMGASPQEPFKIVDNVELVLLDVGVRDQQGVHITDLPKQAFQLMVDGKATNITQFAMVDSPVTIGLIVDNSGSMRYKRKEVVTAGLAFAKESNSQDEFFVVNFNNTVSPGLPSGVPFTDKIQLLHNALFMGDSSGQTALYDAIAFGLKHLERGQREKRTLIVVSDGGDNVSRISQQDVITLIQESRATVYAVGLLDPADSDLKPRILQKFAAVSGGEYFQPEKLEDVIQVLNTISKDIRSRYSIGFTPSAGTTGQMHKIKLSAFHNGQKLIVHSRNVYITD